MIPFHGHQSVFDWQDDLIKEAFVPLIGRGAMALGKGALGLGKRVLKNPLGALGTAWTVSDVATAGAEGARRAASSAARNAATTFSHVGPTM